MKTTNKLFKAQVQEHVLESLMDAVEINSGYDIITTEENLVPIQLQLVLDEFKSWYGPYERKMNPGVYMGFKHWMLGLPSCLNVEYQDYKIHETLKGWFEACGETYKPLKKNEDLNTERERELYYHLVIREFDTLCKKNGLKDIIGTVGY